MLPARSKLGKFIISQDLIETLSVEELIEVTRDVFVLEAKASFVTRGIEYIGLCEQFEPTRDSTEIPLYKLIYDGSNKKRHWVRQTNLDGSRLVISESDEFSRLYYDGCYGRWMSRKKERSE